MESLRPCAHLLAVPARTWPLVNRRSLPIQVPDGVRTPQIIVMGSPEFIGIEPEFERRPSNLRVDEPFDGVDGV